MDRNTRKKEFFRKQKMFGVFIVIFSLVSIPLVMDATWAIFGVPAGLYLIFTKERILMPWYFDEDYEDEEAL